MRYALIAGLLIIALAMLIALSLVPESTALDAEEPAPEPIIRSYGYGTRGVETMPFGEDGPVVISCEAYYEIA